MICAKSVWKTKACTIIRPITKTGTASSANVAVPITLSSRVPALLAAKAPSGIPAASAISIARNVSSRVMGTAELMISPTDRVGRMTVSPMSPVRKPEAHSQ